MDKLIAATNYDTAIYIAVETFRKQLLVGAFGRIAKQLRLGKHGKTHVWRVAKGERISPRVNTALLAEYKRIEQLVEKHRIELLTQANHLENVA